MQSSGSVLRRILAISCLVLTMLSGAPAAQAASTYAKTQYPIVLVHGFLGFKSALGISYFYGVAERLRADGATVYVAQVNPGQTNEYRGEQLIQQLKQWAARDGVTKFNLIGHSQGGPTVRYPAAMVPDMIASVTTVAGDHLGSTTADAWVSAFPSDSWANSLATGLLRVLNVIYGGTDASQTDANAALSSLNSAGQALFNAKFPQGAPTTPCGSGPAKVNGIAYYSVSGNKVLTNFLDILDPFMGVAAQPFGSTPSDGLVSVCSSHWGQVLRDNYPWNHIDEINHVFGLVGWGAPDPLAFYSAMANRLKTSGL